MSKLPTPELIPCGPEKSYFKLIDRIWKAKDSQPTFHRICDLMRLAEAETIILEQILPDSRVHHRFNSEQIGIQRRIGKDARVIFLKLTFIRPSLTRVAEALDLEDNDFLGFVTIAEVQMNNLIQTYVFESVIRPIWLEHPQSNRRLPHPPWSVYLKIKRQFNCNLLHGRKEYLLDGTYFCQQNTLTSLCAHACTSMMLNNCPDTKTLVTCENINSLLGIDHRHRMQEIPVEWGDNTRATHNGLFPKEISRVLREFGYKPYQLDFGSKQRYYREFLYGFIESGYPALLTFTTDTPEQEGVGHLVAVVGHSLNRHSWFPTAYTCYAGKLGNKLLISSLNWVDDFIVHDDNFGMQLCLPAHSFRPEDYPDPGPAFTPKSAIGIFPDKPSSQLLGHVAENHASLALARLFQEDECEKSGVCENYYVKRIRSLISGEDGNGSRAVIRTLRISTDQYISSLRSLDNCGKTYPKEAITKIRGCLQGHEWVWVSEITEPDLFVANQTKLIDVIMRCDFDPETNKTEYPVLVIRFPNHLAFMNLENGNYKFEVRSINGIDGHIPAISTITSTPSTRLTIQA